MSPLLVFTLTTLTMLAFAANSVLTRLALFSTEIDAATFVLVRIVTGALTLWLVVRLRNRADAPVGGSWASAGALFVYAAAFSFAYVVLETGTGALLLFGAVQLTMIGYGLWRGERFSVWQTLGFAVALGGLIYLLLPGLSAPPLAPALLMAAAGAAWGVYSLKGRGSSHPAAESAGNFLRAAPLAVVLIAVVLILPTVNPHLDRLGLFYATLSGSLTSGLGYILWYSVLPSLRATSAATVQLSVPVIAALGGVLFVGGKHHASLGGGVGGYFGRDCGGAALEVRLRRPLPL